MSYFDLSGKVAVIMACYADRHVFRAINRAK